MLKLSFFVPVDYKEKVKSAVFAAGAGRIGNYDQCSWEVEGRGQFRPLAGADPFLGKPGQIEIVQEYKVELVCEDEHIESVVILGPWRFST